MARHGVAAKPRAGSAIVLDGPPKGASLRALFADAEFPGTLREVDDMRWRVSRRAPGSFEEERLRMTAFLADKKKELEADEARVTRRIDALLDRWADGYATAPHWNSAEFVHRVKKVDVEIARTDDVKTMLGDQLVRVVEGAVREQGFEVGASPTILRVELMLRRSTFSVKSRGGSRRLPFWALHVNLRFDVTTTVPRSGGFVPLRVSPAGNWEMPTNNEPLDAARLRDTIRGSIGSLLRGLRRGERTVRPGSWRSPLSAAERAAIRQAYGAAHGTGADPERLKRPFAGLEGVARPDIVMKDAAPNLVGRAGVERAWASALAEAGLAVGEGHRAVVNHWLWSMEQEASATARVDGDSYPFYWILGVPSLFEEDVVYEVDGHIARSRAQLWMGLQLTAALPDEARSDAAALVREGVEELTAAVRAQRRPPSE
jgi:hypothetical protein